MKILTVYDGTIHSKTALRYGLEQAREKKAELAVLQVFQSNLFLDYEGGPMAEDHARAEAARFRRDADTIIAGAKGNALPVTVLYEEGDVVEETIAAATREKVTLVLAPPRYGALTKRAPCPVYIMPGKILVPVDAADALQAGLSDVIKEAKASGSSVLVLGIVPVHLYSPAEAAELGQIQRKTAAAVRRTRTAVSEQGVEASEVIRSGYPDEEILKAAEEFTASLIMLPAGGKTPSELTKAAAILLQEPDRVARPVYLLPAEA